MSCMGFALCLKNMHEYGTELKKISIPSKADIISDLFFISTNRDIALYPVNDFNLLEHLFNPS